MTNRTSVLTRAILGGMALAMTIVGGSAGTAHAALQVPELPVAVRICPVDTSPEGRSCLVEAQVTSGSTGSTQSISVGWTCYQNPIGTTTCRPYLIWCPSPDQACIEVP